MGSIYSELPRWKCHKVVTAAPVLSAVVVNDGTDWLLTLDLGAAPGASRPSTLDTRLHRDPKAEKAPAVGDYFVLYEDGYKSWSPKKAFEEGYTRL